eukprot:3258969-Amphidinium_carterae.1
MTHTADSSKLILKHRYVLALHAVETFETHPVEKCRKQPPGNNIKWWQVLARGRKPNRVSKTLQAKTKAQHAKTIVPVWQFTPLVNFYNRWVSLSGYFYRTRWLPTAFGAVM